jgi:cobalamin biosynthesis protein CobT
MADNNQFECFVPGCEKGPWEKESHRNQHYSRTSAEKHEQHRNGEYKPELGHGLNDNSGDGDPSQGEETLDEPLQSNAKVVEIPEENKNDEDEQGKWREPEDLTPRQIEKAYEEQVDGAVIVQRLIENPNVSEVNLETKKTR